MANNAEHLFTYVSAIRVSLLKHLFLALAYFIIGLFIFHFFTTDFWEFSKVYSRIIDFSNDYPEVTIFNSVAIVCHFYRHQFNREYSQVVT